MLSHNKDSRNWFYSFWWHSQVLCSFAKCLHLSWNFLSHSTFVAVLALTRGTFIVSNIKCQLWAFPGWLCASFFIFPNSHTTSILLWTHSRLLHDGNILSLYVSYVRFFSPYQCCHHFNLLLLFASSSNASRTSIENFIFPYRVLWLVNVSNEGWIIEAIEIYARFSWRNSAIDIQVFPFKLLAHSHGHKVLLNCSAF